MAVTSKLYHIFFKYLFDVMKPTSSIQISGVCSLLLSRMSFYYQTTASSSAAKDFNSLLLFFLKSMSAREMFRLLILAKEEFVRIK